MMTTKKIVSLTGLGLIFFGGGAFGGYKFHSLMSDPTFDPVKSVYQIEGKQNELFVTNPADVGVFKKLEGEANAIRAGPNYDAKRREYEYDMIGLYGSIAATIIGIYPLSQALELALYRKNARKEKLRQ